MDHVQSLEGVRQGATGVSAGQAKTGTIFRQTLRDSRKAIIGLGLAGALMAIWVTAMFPMMAGLEVFNTLLENPLISALVGDVGDYTTPQGFLGSEFFGFMPLFLAVYIVIVGLNITGADEASGALDVLLGTPVRRWQVIVERLLAQIVAYLLILAMIFAGFVLILTIMPEVEIAISRVGEGVLNMVPIMLVQTTLALLLSNLVRGKGRAGGIAGLIIVASYFVYALADLAPDVLGTVQHFSMFSYYGSYAVLSEGFQWGNSLLLIAAAVVMTGLALVFFERRDVSV